MKIQGVRLRQKKKKKHQNLSRLDFACQIDGKKSLASKREMSIWGLMPSG